MSAQHTPGRLEVDNTGYRAEHNGLCLMIWPECIAVVGAGYPDQPQEANARRLVACWNACQVITDPENVVPRLLALNELVPNLEHQAATLRVQRDELLAALKEARRWIGDGECSDGLAREHWTQEYRAAVDRIDAAMAKVTGEQT